MIGLLLGCASHDTWMLLDDTCLLWGACGCVCMGVGGGGRHCKGLLQGRL